MAKRATRKRSVKAAARSRKTAQNIRPRASKPKDRPLPGLEDSRIVELDEGCEVLADIRESKNRLVNEEDALKKTLQKVMRSHGKMMWFNAGITLARVPGDEKLRVTASKEKATAAGDPDAASETATPESDGAQEIGTDD